MPVYLIQVTEKAESDFYDIRDVGMIRLGMRYYHYEVKQKLEAQLPLWLLML